MNSTKMNKCMSSKKVRKDVTSYRDLVTSGILATEWKIVSCLYNFYNKVRKVPKLKKQTIKRYLLNASAYKLMCALLEFVVILKKNNIHFTIGNLVECTPSHTYTVDLTIMNKKGEEIDKVTIYFNRAKRFLTNEDYKYLMKSLQTYLYMWSSGIDIS